MYEGLLAKCRVCSVCGDETKLLNCDDRPYGFYWECRVKVNKRHMVELSIRSVSWLKQSRMMLVEILKLGYWWCQDLDQRQIRHKLDLAKLTGIGWDNFC